MRYKLLEMVLVGVFMVKLTITFTPVLNEATFVVGKPFIARLMKRGQSIFLIHHR